MTEILLAVESIGARGDGIARHQGAPVFLALTAPGDVVRATIDGKGQATVLEILTRGMRQEPPCPHFGVCGGCSLQHLSDDSYRHAKETLVREALAHRGLDDTEIAPLTRIAAGTRRRARLALAKQKDGEIHIGFRQRARHRIADMRTCLVLHPKLVALVPALRQLGRAILREGEAAVSLTLAESGIDLLVDLALPPDLAALEALARFANEHDLARLSWRGAKEAPTPVAQRRPVQVRIARVNVDLPPDCFLQASAESDAVLTDLVRGGIGPSSAIADLFSGIGTFTFALVGPARVHAVDGDQPAISALQAAARRAGLGERVTMEHRDLEQRPLLAAELARFDAVLFDPPHAGARAQVRELARSAVKRIVAVSCNPASFARDARTLVDGGYRLTPIFPVDQFVWSAEIELVAWFER